MTRASHRAGLVLFCMVLLGASSAAWAQSIATSSFTIRLSDGTAAELSFSSEPLLTGCHQVSSTDELQTWDCSEHSLELRFSRIEGADLIAFVLQSRDGFPFNLHEFSARVAVPNYAGDALWTFNRQADRDIMETNLARSWVFFSAANRGIPFAALVDRQGLIRMALGLLAQDHVVLMRGESSANKKDFILTLRQTDNIAVERFEDTLYISRKGDHWFHGTQKYTAAVDQYLGYLPPVMPEGVMNATYDTWYWSLDRINQDMTWNLAKLSQTLGFKTYLIDAGWDTRHGEYGKGLKGSTGDYLPPKDAFPDFPRLVDDIRNQLGMKVMLWLQQYAMGRHSIYYPVLGNALCSVGDPAEGPPAETPFLCPNTYATRQHMADLFSRILEAYRPDALWFDWQEEIPQACIGPHWHEFDRFGDGYNMTQKTIMETIREHSPDIFIDMRWPFANLNNKPYTHLWQPIDSSEDFEAMRLRAMVMRPFSSGLIMGTDEMYWDPKISDTEAARFMAAVVFTGVPYFGPNLTAEPALRIEMLKAWLRFYETNKEDLVGGVFSPYGDRDRPDQIIEGRQATFIYYGNRYSGPVQLTKTNDKYYLVNNSSTSGIDLLVSGMKLGRYKIEISDLDLQNRRPPIFVNYWTRPRLRFNVPVGCLLTLTKTP
jgi:hypothetical protein